MIWITTYDDAGRLLVQKTVEETGLSMTGRPHYVLGRHDTTTHYVVKGVVMERPQNTTLLRGTTLTDIPPDAVVTINHVNYVGVGSTMDLSFLRAGAYEVEVVLPFPNQSAKFTVTI